MPPKPSVRSIPKQLLPGLTREHLADLVRRPLWLVVALDHKGRSLFEYGPKPLVGTFLQHLRPNFADLRLATEDGFPALLVTARFDSPRLDDHELDEKTGSLLKAFGRGRNWHQEALTNGEVNGHLIRDRASLDRVAAFWNTATVPRSPDQPPAPSGPPRLDTLRTLEEELARVQAPIIERFHQFLKQLEGGVPETYEQAVETIDAIKRFARLAGRQLLYDGQPVALQCAKPRGCVHASIQARRSEAGKRKAVYVGMSIPPLSSQPAD